MVGSGAAALFHHGHHCAGDHRGDTGDIGNRDAMLLRDRGAHRADIDDFLLGREGEMPQGQPRKSEDDQNDAYQGQGFHQAPSSGLRCYT